MQRERSNLGFFLTVQLSTTLCTGEEPLHLHLRGESVAYALGKLPMEHELAEESREASLQLSSATGDGATRDVREAIRLHDVWCVVARTGGIEITSGAFAGVSRSMVAGSNWHHPLIPLQG